MKNERQMLYDSPDVTKLWIDRVNLIFPDISLLVQTCVALCILQWNRQSTSIMEFRLFISIWWVRNLEMMPKVGCVDAIVMCSFEIVFNAINISNEMIESFIGPCRLDLKLPHRLVEFYMIGKWSLITSICCFIAILLKALF